MLIMLNKIQDCGRDYIFRKMPLLYMSLLLPFAFGMNENLKNNYAKVFNSNDATQHQTIVVDKEYTNYNKHKNVHMKHDRELYNDGKEVSYGFENNPKTGYETDYTNLPSEAKREVLKWLADLLETAEPKEKQSTENQPEIILHLLNKLTKGIDRLNENLAKVNSVFEIAYHEPNLKRDINYDHVHRSKRNLNNSTLANSTLEYVNPDTKADDVPKAEKLIFGNQTDVDKNGRRYMNRLYPQTPNVVKTKLIIYLDDAFLDLQKKLSSVNDIKMTFSLDNNYKIGYVVAILDTLEANLNKLKLDADKNRLSWDDAKILELFDKFRMSDNVVTNLLASLKNYV